MLDGVINRILKEFDFKKTHEVMKLLKWEWNFDGTTRIPCIDDLKTTAISLLESIIKSPDSNYISTGGFTAMRTGEKHKYITLYFTIERASTKE